MKDNTWLRPASQRCSDLQRGFRDLIATAQARQSLLIEMALLLLSADEAGPDQPFQ